MCIIALSGINIIPDQQNYADLGATQMGLLPGFKQVHLPSLQKKYANPTNLKAYLNQLVHGTKFSLIGTPFYFYYIMNIKLGSYFLFPFIATNKSYYSLFLFFFQNDHKT